jgi:hypothetical protein
VTPVHLVVVIAAVIVMLQLCATAADPSLHTATTTTYATLYHCQQQQQEFLGTVPNPGYLPNSLLHGEGRRMYAQCDPRGEISDSEYALLEALQQQGGGSAGAGGSKSKGKGGEPLSNRELARKDVPSRYRCVCAVVCCSMPLYASQLWVSLMISCHKLHSTT